jgi:hypothetical protein
MLTPEAVLAKLKWAARAKAGFIVSVHANARLTERGITRRDLARSFLTSTRAEEQDSGKWLITGVDEDGLELEVVVSIGVGDRIEVITTF